MVDGFSTSLMIESVSDKNTCTFMVLMKFFVSLFSERSEFFELSFVEFLQEDDMTFRYDKNVSGSIGCSTQDDVEILIGCYDFFWVEGAKRTVVVLREGFEIVVVFHYEVKGKRTKTQGERLKDKDSLCFKKLIHLFGDFFFYL